MGDFKLMWVCNQCAVLLGTEYPEHGLCTDCGSTYRFGTDHIAVCWDGTAYVAPNGRRYYTSHEARDAAERIIDPAVLRTPKVVPWYCGLVLTFALIIAVYLITRVIQCVAT